MRKIILGSLAALLLTLGITATQASAAWVTRPVVTFDPSCGQYVTTAQTYWVPDPVVVAPAPTVVIRPARHVEFRGHDYRHGERRDHRR